MHCDTQERSTYDVGTGAAVVGAVCGVGVVVDAAMKRFTLVSFEHRSWLRECPKCGSDGTMPCTQIRWEKEVFRYRLTPHIKRIVPAGATRLDVAAALMKLRLQEGL